MALFRKDSAVLENSKYFYATSKCSKEIERVSFEWKIQNFSVWKNTICSPDFGAFNMTWSLMLLADSTTIRISIQVTEHKQIAFTYKISIKSKTGADHYIKESEHSFPDSETYSMLVDMARRDELEAKKEEFLPNDILTFCCELTKVKYATCNVELPDSRNKNGSSSPHSITSVDNLSRDFAILYQIRKCCDVVLKVDDTEFPAHSVILGARSVVFDAMFQHDMEGKRKKVVLIPNVDVAVFNQLLWFIYTGETKEISFENAVGLFAAADKYAIADLKLKCKNYIRSNLSVDTVCDVAILGDTYNDADLMDSAKTFLRANISTVKFTSQWSDLRRDKLDLFCNLLEDVCAQVSK